MACLGVWPLAHKTPIAVAAEAIQPCMTVNQQPSCFSQALCKLMDPFDTKWVLAKACESNDDLWDSNPQTLPHNAEHQIAELRRQSYGFV